MRAWGAGLAQRRADVVAVGYFGSYARGDWGVGSDIDLVVVVTASPLPFERRAAELDALAVTAIPVPADLLVYTQEEWRRVNCQTPASRLPKEVVWVYRRADDSG